MVGQYVDPERDEILRLVVEDRDIEHDLIEFEYDRGTKQLSRSTETLWQVIAGSPDADLVDISTLNCPYVFR